MDNEKLFNGIYKNKKVLVTGHTGFKGSWLVLWLKLLGAKVIGYALPPSTEYSMFESCTLSNELVSIIGDIRDFQNLEKTILKYKPEFIFHLAAQPLVRYSYDEPYITYETNIMGTLNLYEILRKNYIETTVITVTSDKCYDNKECFYGYRETDPMGGDDPYSSSKGCVELITSAYRKSFFKFNNIPISSVRAGNVIGGGDWAQDRLIPDCIKSIIKGEEIIIRSPTATRPWQHVLEPLSGYLWLGSLMYKNRTTYNNSWNFGPEGSNLLTVENLVKLVIDNWGKGNYIIDNSSNPHETTQLKLDILKSKSILNWSPVYTTFETLEKTLDWYKEFYLFKNNSLCNYSVTQINEYIQKASEQNIIWTK